MIIQKYNTTLSSIKMPEYGRNVEDMIKYCASIPDRDKRTHYARGIVQCMARVKNIEKPTEDMVRVFWDHVALMSNFELDIDYPYEIIKKDSIESKPTTLLPRMSHIKFRQYGLVVERLIKEACAMEDEVKRLRLFELCANHMKLQFHLANPSADEDDNKIIHDLVEYVGPQYANECYNVYLYSLTELKENNQYDPSTMNVTPSKKKKKKKKKK